MEDTEMLAKAMNIIRQQDIIIQKLLDDCAELIAILKERTGEGDEITAGPFLVQ